MKIILITRDRPELTRQTIETMKSNAVHWNEHELIIAFDGTSAESFGSNYPHVYAYNFYKGVNIISGNERLGVGGAKNLGVTWFRCRKIGLEPDDILMFSDNDMYYLPGWDERLEHALEDYGGLVQISQLGGWKHPFHSTNGEGYHDRQDPTDTDGIAYDVDAATGNCFVIRYKDWLKYGPFDSNALGPGQSEDYALSQKVIKDGKIVATLDPPVAIHCGMANCEGNPATGWEEMAKMAEKQIEDYKIDKIWLATPDEGTILLERTPSYSNIIPRVEKSVEEIKKMYPVFSALNVGSGQRRFDNSLGWCNIDCIARPPDQIPDVVLDASKIDTLFTENTQDMVVLHHVLEHFGCGEADEVLKQCYKVLKPGGSLLVFVPDLRRLAGRWLSGELDDFSFLVNVYGAYQGLDGDRHKWGYDIDSLKNYLVNTLFKGDYRQQVNIKKFDWRTIPGADIARDWWILGLEVLK